MALYSFLPAGSRRDDVPELSVDLDLVTGRVVLVGRLDRATAHLVHDAVSALLMTGCPRWTVDVTRATVGDDHGLRALAVAHRRADRHHRPLALLGATLPAPRATQRVAGSQHAVAAAEVHPAWLTSAADTWRDEQVGQQADRASVVLVRPRRS